jgi:hypothetical protein
MRYFCLVYTDEAEWEALSAENRVALLREGQDLDEVLWKSGRCLASGRLEAVQTATTVRVRGGRVALVDGPFAETKERLAGFYLIDARDLNDAIRTASTLPSAQFGSVEVRPVRVGGHEGSGLRFVT